MFQIAWVMFDGSFDIANEFASLSELHEWARKWPSSEYVWRQI